MLAGCARRAPGNGRCIRACRYLRQIAVITPYAEFKFQYAAEDEKSSMKTTFARRTDKMPAPPKVRPETEPGTPDCHQAVSEHARRP